MHIREAISDDIPGIARVHVDTWRTAYIGIVPAEYLAKLSYERSEARWRENLFGQGDAGFALVAEADGLVVGFAGGGPERDGIPGYDGELYALYVLASYQRRNIGQTLLHTAAQRLAADGFKAMLLWVLQENAQARAFYEAMGGVWVDEKAITIGGAELIDVAYGWPDLHTWLAAQERP